MAERSTPTDDQARLTLLDAVAGGGAFTVGDLTARTGLPPHVVERQLTTLVSQYASDLDVDEEGTLVYRFEPGPQARPDVVAEDRKRRRRQALQRAFMAAFKAWTVVMVIVYAVIMAMLLIAFVVAVLSAQKGGDGGGRRRSTTSRSGGSPFTWYWIGRMMSDRGYRRHTRRRRKKEARRIDDEIRKGRDPYAMRPGRAERAEDDKPSLVDRTWYFLFGSASIERTPLEEEKELLTYIRAKKGIISNADIAALLGVTYAEADGVGTRLVATYEGEMDLTDEGLPIYRFPDVMVSARPEIEEQEPRLGFLWDVRRREHALRANPTVLVPALNLFNLLVAVFAYTTILPTLQLTSGLAVFFLSIFPASFSLVFFAVAFRRWLKERVHRARWEADNIRISVYRLLFVRRREVLIPGDERALAEAELGSWGEAALRKHAPDVAAAVRGRLEDRPGGAVAIVAPRLWAEIELVERLRRKAEPRRAVGRTVFSSRDIEVVETDDALAREIASLDA